MENKIRVLVVDDGNIVKEVKQYFSSHVVIGVLCNKEDDLDKISSNYKDMIEMDLILPKEDCNLKLEITSLLHSLGIPSHIKGYYYIRDSIDLMYNDSSLDSITKEVYPKIALRYDTTASRVERAIRHAIDISWNRGDYNVMESLFGNSIDYDKAKPTNLEFIVTLVDKLRLDNNLL